jgi:hypothetical protein
VETANSEPRRKKEQSGTGTLAGQCGPHPDRVGAPSRTASEFIAAPSARTPYHQQVFEIVTAIEHPAAGRVSRLNGHRGLMNEPAKLTRLAGLVGGHVAIDCISPRHIWLVSARADPRVWNRRAPILRHGVCQRPASSARGHCVDSLDWPLLGLAAPSSPSMVRGATVSLVTGAKCDCSRRRPGRTAKFDRGARLGAASSTRAAFPSCHRAQVSYRRSEFSDRMARV